MSSVSVSDWVCTRKLVCRKRKNRVLKFFSLSVLCLIRILKIFQTWTSIQTKRWIDLHSAHRHRFSCRYFFLLLTHQSQIPIYEHLCTVHTWSICYEFTLITHTRIFTCKIFFFCNSFTRTYQRIIKWFVNITSKIFIHEKNVNKKKHWKQQQRIGLMRFTYIYVFNL